MPNNKTRVFVISTSVLTMIASAARASTLYDSGGFEAAAGFSAGTLAGQASGSALKWLVTTTAGGSGASTVAVEPSTVYQGSQAVGFTRTAANRDTYYAPYVNDTSLSQRYVNVGWEMNVAAGATQDPFFGVFAFNGSTWLGYAGVDASTGQVQYSQAGTGGLLTSGTSVSLGTWNSFDLQFDYTSQTETIFVNGVAAAAAGFARSSQTGFTDGDLASFATNAAQTGAGTVYFDNYQVTTSNSVFGGAANLTWLNTGGTGDGATWDVNNSQNFNNGSSAIVYHDGDNVIFNDTNNSHYSVTLNTLVSPGSTVIANSLGNYVFSGSGGIGGAGGLTKTGTGSLTVSTVSSYTGGTVVSGGTLILAGLGAFPANTNLSIGSAANVVVANHDSNPVVVLAVANLSVGGRLDLGNNALVVESTSAFTMVNSEVAQGYNGGSWTGLSGITSSTAASDSKHLTALGVISNDNGKGGSLYGSGTALGLFEGTNPATDDALVKYTYFGDANLDGKVDASDYSRIDNGILTHATGWYNGDFNYDGVINGSDYTLIDNAFNTQGAALAGILAAPTAQIAASPSPVPEPKIAACFVFACALQLVRRRHANRC